MQRILDEVDINEKVASGTASAANSGDPVRKSGTQARILDLQADNFFREPRRLEEVLEELRIRGYHFFLRKWTWLWHSTVCFFTQGSISNETPLPPFPLTAKSFLSSFCECIAFLMRVGLFSLAPKGKWKSDSGFSRLRRVCS